MPEPYRLYAYVCPAARTAWSGQGLPLFRSPVPEVPYPWACMAWWLQRGGNTRSHSELGREDPQRRWYCVSRRGRVGRCQALQAHGPRVSGWQDPAGPDYLISMRKRNPFSPGTRTGPAAAAVRSRDMARGGAVW